MKIFGSRAAYRVFAVCSWVVLALALFLAFEATPWYPRSDAGFGAGFFFIVGLLLNTVDAPAILIIWVAMIVHCFTRYPGSKRFKLGWLVLLFCTACVGAVIYFFCVYSPQQRKCEPSVSEA